MFLSALAVLVVLSPIVIIHEFGHFLACRLTGIRVNEFSFGFGKILWHKKKGDTDYQIRLIPFGGFVEPAGPMFHPKDAKEAPKPYEFAAKKWYAKFFMVINGALFNYVLAAVIFSALVYVKGVPQTDPTLVPAVVGQAVEDYPAAKAGIKPGDVIVRIDGKEISSWNDVSPAAEARQGALQLTVKREGKTLTLTLPESSFNAEKPNMLGIAVEPVILKVGPVKAVGFGLYQCWYWTKYSLASLWDSFTHKKAPDLAGPIGIVNIIHKTAHGELVNFIFLIGMLSLAVGMFNLFPIPILDGGYALVFLLEGITRRLPSERVVNIAMNCGFYALILLVLYASYADVKRIFFKPKPAVVAATQTAAPQTDDKPQEAN